MTNAVQDDLGDGALAVDVLVAGLVIDRAREALQGLGLGRGIALEGERQRGRIGPEATGIAWLICSAWSGATCFSRSGGGAGGAACVTESSGVEFATPAIAAKPIRPSTPAPIVSRG